MSWLPASRCSPRACLGEPPPPAPLRVARRLCALVGMLLLALVATPGPARSRATLRAVGVQLHVTGAVPEGGALLVANHLSWIDVLALTTLGPVRMVAKREIAGWPVIGRLAARSGALFVDRAGLRALPATIAEAAAALRSGAVVGVFPEGTTWCGSAAGPFRRAAFQAAIDSGVPVVPVALVLRDSRQAAFVGDQTLWDSLSRVLRAPVVACEVTVLAPLPRMQDRRALAAAAAASVAGVTGVQHPVAERRVGRVLQNAG